MTYTTDFDELYKQLEMTEVNPHKLVSKNASEKTKALFEYLKSLYGSHIIAGQQYLQEEELEDIVYNRYAGKLPAIRGYDLMDMDKKKGDNQLPRAIEWAKKTGSIITMCWHWYAPDDMNNTDSCMWSFYSNRTDNKHTTSFDLLKAVQAGTKEYDFVVSRIDKAAAMLKEFEKEDIPVLFRPLHEAYGNWFWWGNRGDDSGESIEAYKKLWYMIFDRMENYHKLTNLIWVWNGQNKCMAVSPNTFDICGEDIYSPIPNDHSSQIEKFSEVTSYTDGKMAALSECGFIPAPDALKADNAKWLWWLPWWGSFVYTMDEKWQTVFDENGLPTCNKKYMDEEFMRKTFSDEYVITLDRLPWYNKEKAAEFLKAKGLNNVI